MNENGPEVFVRPCGCTTVHDPNTLKEPVLTPCVSCALNTAGLMLIEAAKRLAEAAEKQREEDAERAEAARQQAEDFIGGTD